MLQSITEHYYSCCIHGDIECCSGMVQRLRSLIAVVIGVTPMSVQTFPVLSGLSSGCIGIDCRRYPGACVVPLGSVALAPLLSVAPAVRIFGLGSWALLLA